MGMVVLVGNSSAEVLPEGSCPTTSPYYYSIQSQFNLVIYSKRIIFL